MRRKKVDEYSTYRFSPNGTALLPFKPKRSSYDSAKAYKEDMAHIGENTWMRFRTKDIHAMQRQLHGKGVRFKRKAELAMWGGMEAEFYDPDDNTYTLYQPRSATQRKLGKR